MGRIWSHVVLTHFPISFFMISAVFMALHLRSDSACFERSAYICLVAGTVSLLPATLSGWLTWRSRYRGVRTEVFVRKLRIALALVPLGTFLVVWQRILLFVGVVLEGMYGGRPHHHDAGGA